MSELIGWLSVCVCVGYDDECVTGDGLIDLGGAGIVVIGLHGWCVLCIACAMNCAPLMSR